MRHFLWFFRFSKLALFAMAGWLMQGTALYAAPLAQEAEKKSDGGGSYLLPYALTMAGIVLGLLFVCRTSRRHDRAK